MLKQTVFLTLSTNGQNLNMHIVIQLSQHHYGSVIMGAIASQITSLTIVYSNRLFRRRSKKTSKLRATGLCAGNPRGPVNSPHTWPVMWKMFLFDDVIMYCTLKLLKLTKALSQWLAKWHLSPVPKAAGRCACLGEFEHLLGITWLWEVITAKLGRALLRKGLPCYMPCILYLSLRNWVLHCESL